MNIKQALDEYCIHQQYIKGLSKLTVKDSLHINSRLICCLQVERLEDITFEMVKDFFYHGRIELGWGASTFQTYRQVILGFFKWAMAEGYLKELFIDRIVRPKVPKRIRAKLSKDEAYYWLKFVRNYPYVRHQDFYSARNEAIYAIFLFTGLRRAELLNLEFKDIDVKNLELRVRGGKGNKDRLIPLCFRYIRILEQYLEIRRSYNITSPELFCSLRSKSGLHIQSLVKLHKRLRKDAKLNCTIHQLRHTF